MKISALVNMVWNVFLLVPGSPWISYTLPAVGVGEDYLWVKTLDPDQLFLLCPEDPLLQSLVEGPQELASCQHTVMNSLGREERRRHWVQVRLVSHNQRYMAYTSN